MASCKFSRLAGRLVIFAALLPLAGCIYIPFPERISEAGAAGDFRDCYGPRGSAKKLYIGVSDRQAVVELLGQPELMTADGNAFGYTLGTVSGLRIFLPFFFLPMDAVAHAYGLRIEFGTKGCVEDFKLFQTDRDINNDFIGYTGMSRFWVVDKMNQQGLTLYRPEDLSRHIMPTTRHGPDFWLDR